MANAPGGPTLRLHLDTYARGREQRPHEHDELHFSLVLAGGVVETVGSRAVAGGPLSVVCKDTGVRHANRFAESGARFARLSLNGGAMGNLIDDARRAEEWHWTHDPAVAAPYLRLLRRFRGLVLAVPSTDPDLLDLLAAFTARPAAETRGVPPAWLAQVMDELRTDWRPSMQVADVARRAGVHPVYLARCVRRWYRTGVAEELRRLRVRSAAAGLAESSRTVSDLAHDNGFADEAHLCRTFRRATGIPPGAFRSLLRELPEPGRVATT
jgi:AraC family transcriptional regulator